MPVFKWHVLYASMTLQDEIPENQIIIFEGRCSFFQHLQIGEESRYLLREGILLSKLTT